MTEKDLNSLYWLTIEIERIEERIHSLKSDSLGASALDGLPHSGTVGRPTEALAIKYLQLVEELEDLCRQKVQKEHEIIEFIESVDDEEIKVIMRLRYIHCMCWADIASAVSSNFKDTHRTTVSKKLKRWLKENLTE